MTGFLLAAAALALALPAAAVFLRNLRLYREPPLLEETDAAGPPPAVSVLIPARDEEHSIGAAVESALASRGAEVEVIVLDDRSRDGTARAVEAIAARDARVRLIAAPPLPPGWCGKQHACSLLAAAASRKILLFVDADVRLEPDACARIARFLERSGAGLASGIPRQETGTWLEKLLIPLIHFLLLGFLPIGRMRASRHPAYGAGCGQLIAVRRRDYETAGGHAAIRASLHDGIQLPRAFRAAGFSTDLFDATGIARCRMYRGAAAVWNGLSKNAVEGLAAPGTILPATVLLAGGQVLPFLLLAAAPLLHPAAAAIAAAAALLALIPRLTAVERFGQPLAGALLHPIGVAVLLAIQWTALARHLAGRPATWKSRSYSNRSWQPAGLPQKPALD